MIAAEFPRPESLPTVIFPGEPSLDPDPIRTPGDRLIPGPAYSKEEFEVLFALSGAFHELPLPTPRQLARISLNAETGCWELPVYADTKGRARYGQLSVAGLTNPSNLAHRTMYLVFYGADALPGGRHDFLDHLCENKPCCYPRHLERVTPGVNTLRGRAKIVAGQLALDELLF